MKAKFSEGSLRFKVPHAAENAAVAAFRSGGLNHLLPPATVVTRVCVAPSEPAAAESIVVVDLRAMAQVPATSR